MPSSQKARAEVWRILAQLSPQSGQTIVDLGSGWGGLVIALALRYPQCHILGYELSWFPWCISKVVQRVLGVKNLTLYRRDYLQQPLPKADIAICYLYPEGMQRLAYQRRCQHWQATHLISICFALPAHAAVLTAKAADFYQTPVYLYRL